MLNTTVEGVERDPIFTLIPATITTTFTTTTTTTSTATFTITITTSLTNLQHESGHKFFFAAVSTYCSHDLCHWFYIYNVDLPELRVISFCHTS